MKAVVSLALLACMILAAWAAFRGLQIERVIAEGNLMGNADRLAMAHSNVLLSSLWAGVAGVTGAVLWIAFFASRMNILGWICLLLAIVSVVGGSLLVRDSRAIYNALSSRKDTTLPRELIPDEPLPDNWLLFSADARSMNPITFIRYGGFALGRKAKMLALAEAGLLLATLLWFRQTEKDGPPVVEV